MTATERIEAPIGRTRGASFAIVALTYVAAIAVAIAVLALDVIPSMEDGALHAAGLGAYARMAIADVLATLVVFVASFAVRNTSVYDAYWMTAPPLFCVGGWALACAPDVLDLRQIACTLIVCAWALRLTWNWIRGWQGLDHEDFRYRDLQKKTGRAYWLVSLAGLHLFPTALVLVTMLPLAVIFAPAGAPLGPWDLSGLAISAMGILVQAIADEQLRAFTATRTDRDAICDRGLWRYSRHPNYFGEISFWTGLAFLALATGHAPWWSWLGVPAIVGLFTFASIPMMEARQARKPGWAEHVRRTSVLVPWPPRGR